MERGARETQERGEKVIGYADLARPDWSQSARCPGEAASKDAKVAEKHGAYKVDGWEQQQLPIAFWSNAHAKVAINTANIWLVRYWQRASERQETIPARDVGTIPQLAKSNSRQQNRCAAQNAKQSALDVVKYFQGWTGADQIEHEILRSGL